MVEKIIQMQQQNWIAFGVLRTKIDLSKADGTMQNCAT